MQFTDSTLTNQVINIPREEHKSVLSKRSIEVFEFALEESMKNTCCHEQHVPEISNNPFLGFVKLGFD